MGFFFPVVEIECQDNGCGGKEAKDKKEAISKNLQVPIYGKWHSSAEILGEREHGPLTLPQDEKS